MNLHQNHHQRRCIPDRNNDQICPHIHSDHDHYKGTVVFCTDIKRGVVAKSKYRRSQAKCRLAIQSIHSATI